MRPLLACTFLALFTASCHVVETRRVQYPTQPIAVKVINKYIDEDSPLEYGVKFRNTGTQVISFDYTIADEQGVPHVDADGPNSGLVENLYPGEEREVPNPLNRMAVFVTLGRVTYGKQEQLELMRIYRPGAVVPSGGDEGLFGGLEAEGDLPTP